MSLYAFASGGRAYFWMREGGTALLGMQRRRASCTASRTARWVSEPFSPYTGTMPFKRKFFSRSSKEGLTMEGAPMPYLLLTRP